jgi:hypothetical protein
MSVPNRRARLDCAHRVLSIRRQCQLLRLVMLRRLHLAPVLPQAPQRRVEMTAKSDLIAKRRGRDALP